MTRERSSEEILKAQSTNENMWWEFVLPIDFCPMTFGRGFLSADLISSKERGRRSLFSSRSGLDGRSPAACCWCSFSLGRTGVALSDLPVSVSAHPCYTSKSIL